MSIFLYSSWIEYLCFPIETHLYGTITNKTTSQIRIHTLVNQRLFPSNATSLMHSIFNYCLLYDLITFFIILGILKNITECRFNVMFI